MWQYAAMAGLQVWSTLEQTAAARRTAALNKQISQMNAHAAEIDAWEAERLGFSETARYATVVDQTISDQKVAFANKNVDVNFGTAAELQAETKLTGLLNILDIQRAARAKSIGLKIEASNIRLGSQMRGIQSRIDESAIRTRGLMNAGSTALSGYDRYKAPETKSSSTNYGWE